MHYLHLLTCPVCHSHFTEVGNTLKCDKGHTFDIAKEGYINLLTKKLSDSVGDTKEMLLARRNFLDRGYYQPLSDTINKLIYDFLRTEEDSENGLPYINILDAGCGEGYYLGRLQHYLDQQLPAAQCNSIGLDISKDAMRMAAKRYKDAHFVVANLKERLVFASDSLHILLNIFAPRNIDEFARVVTPGGIAIVVIPGPQHLRQLRSTLQLLNIEENKQQHVIDQFAPYFELLTSSSLIYEVQLSNQGIMQAVMMTPNYWHLSDEVKEAIGRMEGVRTEIEFTCLMFRKRKS